VGEKNHAFDKKIVLPYTTYVKIFGPKESILEVKLELEVLPTLHKMKGGQNVEWLFVKNSKKITLSKRALVLKPN
jgi:hypothetical protein